MWIKIIQEQEPDFSEKICDGVTPDDLDEKAIDKLKMQNIKTVSLDNSVITDKNDSVDMRDFLQSKTEDNPKTLYYRERLENKIERIEVDR